MVDVSVLSGSRPPANARWFPVLLGACAVAGGVLALIGWAADAPRLTDWTGQGISMLPNTAIAAVAAGAALILVAVRPHSVGVVVLGAVVLAIGSTTLLEHITGWNLGIDTLVFPRDWGQRATLSPGRMGPPASLSNALLGLGIVCASSPQGSRRRLVSSVLGLVAALLALTPLVGYLFHASFLFTVPQATGIALPTASILVALAVGLVVAVPEQQPVRTLLEDSGGGLLARRGLPVIVVLSLVLGWVSLQGEEAGLYDTGLGTAILVVTLIVLLSAVLWWGAAVVSVRERALAESAEVFRILGEAVPDFLWMADSAGRPIYQNPAWQKYTGLSYEPTATTGWEVLCHGDDLAHLQSRWSAAIWSGEAFELELRIRRFDGEFRWFTGRTVPVKDASGQVVKWVGTLTDIDDRKRAQELLQEADRRKDEFLATLAHELRNPLAPVRNCLEIMKLASDDARLMDEARQTIDRQMAQMERLIDDLLDVSRITRNKLELRQQRVELAPIVSQALEACRPLAETARHDLSAVLPAEPIFLYADAARLSQVFNNLLNNACKYTPPEGAIRLVAEREGSDVVVTVRDNGIGIPADMLPRVFEMFTQVDRSLERSHGGLGIGLTLVKQLVEMHGGSVQVTSAGPGQGTEVVVRLPIDVEQASPPAAEPSPEPAAARPRRILVVDDNADAAISLAKLLRMNGHETFLAHDGQTALEVARRERPDVILLDIGLPKMNGYDVCRAIRAEPWGQPVRLIALTGWGQDEDRRRSSAAGFDGHLVKPVDYGALMKLVAGNDGPGGTHRGSYHSQEERSDAPQPQVQ